MFNKFKSFTSLVLVFALMFGLFLPISAVGATSTTTTPEASPQLEQKVASASVDQKKTVDIISFNDFHGALAEDVRQGRDTGMVKLVAATRNAVAKNPNTIVVAAGDNYSGTAKSNLTHGAPVSAMMKAMGVVASSVGNHEFNWGTQFMEKWAVDGGFDFLAANIIDTATGESVKWAKPYMIVEKGGLKVAFIGLSHPDTATLTKRQHVAGLEFTDPVAVAKEWVTYLQEGKAKEGKPDVIIALTHIDSNQASETKVISGNVVKLANEVKGLDGIITGHSHRNVSGTVNNVPIVQAGFNGRLLGKLSIELTEDGKVKEILPSLDDLSNRKDDIIGQEDTAKVLEKLDNELNPILKEKLGTATQDFTHVRSEPNVSPLGKLATEIMREKAGVQIAIQNGGGLRRTLAAGDITVADMYEIIPFDNYLVTMDLPGKDIKKAIDHGIMNPDVTDGQFSGLKVVFDKDAEFGNRIVSISLEDGTPLVMDKLYSVVTNDFMFTGGDKYDFSNAKNVVETFIPIRDVFVEYIKEKKVLTPTPVTNIVEKSEAPEAEAVQEPKKPEEPQKPTENVKPAKPTPVEPAKPSVTPEKKADKEYIVKKGDTLAKIAKAHNTTYQKLAEYNNLKDPNKISIGQKILIPATENTTVEKSEKIYVVKKGDTLDKIAKAHNTTYQKIAEYNGIKNPNRLSIGQEIKIPA
ncbi:5'-nucleotidase C-terminal domain-containing protein [Caldalkalibacillus mannanilyticus]|uniref:5'-nucleotidase C-terminal domain-containing protein n=1 Tax=Caldalkalibacillus mannanilyticus TaxID=1418 RepID=UPI00046A06BE|nr:5'-nucleotidase C-terminal domain-containing protein [Caldalkalibacillus mannanilyticus]